MMQMFIRASDDPEYKQWMNSVGQKLSRALMRAIGVQGTFILGGQSLQVIAEGGVLHSKPSGILCIGHKTSAFTRMWFGIATQCGIVSFHLFGKAYKPWVVECNECKSESERVNEARRRVYVNTLHNIVGDIGNDDDEGYDDVEEDGVPVGGPSNPTPPLRGRLARWA